MKILITGGAGFLGTNLIKELVNINKDVELTIIDNFLTGDKSNLLKLADLGIRPEVISQDINEALAIENSFQYIFHMACPASPEHYQAKSLQTLYTSILGTKNILEFAQKNNSRVLFTSTSEIYGDPEVNPQREDYWGNVNSFGPRSCYDEGKRAAEAMCFEFIKHFNLDIRIARIFNTYGPYMQSNDGRVVSNFINQAIKQKDITIYGDGSQTRSFCYVDDLIKGLLALMFIENNPGLPVNIGNPHEFKVIDLAQKVINLTSSSSKIVHLSLPIDDPKQRRPDISFASQFLNWAPEILLEDGLKKTIDYFKQ